MRPDLLFFADIARQERAAYVDEMSRVIESDEEIYRTVILNIHNQSRYLFHTKYRYIRWSYFLFLVGLVAAALIELGLLAAR